MNLEKFPLSKTVTQPSSLQQAHSVTPDAVRDKLIDISPVCVLIGAKKSTVYSWLRDPKSDFPKPVRLGARMTRWSEKSILNWVQSRINGTADTNEGAQQ